MEATVSECQISEVSPEALSRVWPKAETAIRKGLMHTGGDTASAGLLYREVLEGRAIMWAGHRDEEISLVIIFDIRLIGSRRMIFIKMLAGRDLAQWIEDGLYLLKDYAKIIGAEGIRASCRPGLARLLKRRGWKKKAVVMETE